MRQRSRHNLVWLVGVWLPVAALAEPPGDLDCDGALDFKDINPFTLALSNPEAYAAAFPGCDIMLADINNDGLVDFRDINPFVVLLAGGGPGEIYTAQLAGNTLDEYPYFEYVKAFNENATIEVALDPTRYPEIAGQMADIYVVEAKTAAAWSVDPNLVDVTLDGAQTETFGDDTIQDNTFLVVGPYELDSAVFDPATGNYTGLGHGYDVVVDMNRNGVLDNGDYIDGLGREAGLYVVHDTTELGPLTVATIPPYSVGAIFGIPPSYTNEIVYYPANLAEMEPRPLVVIGHGAGHEYIWYGHIGHHMASYGYIVMSHQNCYGPPECTLGHTDAILDLQDEIGGGVLSGKIDANRIIWIGHSRGGEGVTLAIDAVVEGTYEPTHYSRESIVLISAMLPIVNPSADVYDVNFHLWTASGDSDVSGAASWDLVQTFHLHDRATKYRISSVVQGTGHAWFHAGPATPAWFEGPCEIGQENTHLIELGLYLPLMKYFAEGNIAATDFLWRQYERFHPIGVDTSNPCIVVTNEYRNGADDGNFYIDDYQSQEALNVSSSGGAVTYTVQNVLEGRLDDNNSSFSWTSSDPFNGATQASAADTTRGVVFDWNGADRYYEWEVIPEQRDFSDDLYLSFRGAQGTQHPFTMAELGDLTFSVTLRDGSGTESSINIGAYGGGLEQPYARNGGWHNEMEVIRIRPTDFVTNGSGLDLTDVVAVRFDLGPSWGSPEGRIVVDELMLTNDFAPYFVNLSIELLGTAPEFLPPGTPTTFQVQLAENDDILVAGSPTLHYSLDGGATWLATPLEMTGPEIWEGVLPALLCTDQPRYYFSAAGDVSGTVTLPAAGAAGPFAAVVGVFHSILDDDFENDLGWTVASDPSLTGGEWDRGVPIDDGVNGDPTEDFDGSGKCFLTDNRLGNSDVDWGPTWMISPALDLADLFDPVVRFAYWWHNDDQDGDPMSIEVGTYDPVGEIWNWTVIDTIANVDTAWFQAAYDLTDYVSLTDAMKIRISAMDNPNNSIDEGAIDAFEIFDVTCE